MAKVGWLGVLRAVLSLQCLEGTAIVLGRGLPWTHLMINGKDVDLHPWYCRALLFVLRHGTFFLDKLYAHLTAGDLSPGTMF